MGKLPQCVPDSCVFSLDAIEHDRLQQFNLPVKPFNHNEYLCFRRHLCAITCADTQYIQTCVHSDLSTRQTYRHDTNTPNLLTFVSMLNAVVALRMC